MNLNLYSDNPVKSFEVVKEEVRCLIQLDRGLLLQVNRLGNLKIIVLRNELEWKYIL